jgi:hypothetical protein
MLMAFISVFCAFIYTIIAALLIKAITNYFIKRQKSYEIGFILSAVTLGMLSIALLLVDAPFMVLNAFLKAGLSFSILQLLISPVLVILKGKNKKAYKKVIDWFEERR